MISSMRWLSGILFTAVLLTTTFCTGEALAAREVHKLELAKHQGPGQNPYSLFYDIQVIREGPIKATITIDEFGASGYKGNVVTYIRQYKKDSDEADYRDSCKIGYKKFSRPGTYILLGAVDSPSLRYCERFRVELHNFMNIPVRGTLVIEYPGKEDAGQTTGGQGQAHGECDLAVTNLALTGDSLVMVDIKNNGPGEVPSQVWTSSESASVMLFREGKRWGGVSIKVIDPQRNLQKPGGTIRYVSNLKVIGPEKITAVVDYGNRIREADKENNGKVATLGAPAGPSKGFKPRTFKP